MSIDPIAIAVPISACAAAAAMLRYYRLKAKVAKTRRMLDRLAQS